MSDEKGFPHYYVQLARRAIESYLTEGSVLSAPDNLSEDMMVKSGVFVSLKKGGTLRGCIGTFLPVTENLYDEIVRNAIAAAVEDPRFPRVQTDELQDISISVDVLSPPERVGSVSELDPKKYGVIVSKGFRRGLLLPDLEGVNTVQEQLRIAKMKAGIDADDNNIEVFKFTVKRHR